MFCTATSHLPMLHVTVLVCYREANKARRKMSNSVVGDPQRDWRLNLQHLPTFAGSYTYSSWMFYSNEIGLYVYAILGVDVTLVTLIGLNGGMDNLNVVPLTL